MADAFVLRDRMTEIVEKYRDGVAPIVSLGEAVLREVAAPYEGQVGDDVLREFVEVMRRTMQAAPGVGLAAPQIGVPVQIAVLEDPAELPTEVAEARQRYPMEYFVAINPQYRADGDARRGFYEGCLSMPGFTGVVNRHLAVQAAYTDPAGGRVERPFTGWQARIVQHETDHLRGIVYVDKLEPRSLSTTQSYLDNWNSPVPTQAAETLAFRLD